MAARACGPSSPGGEQSILDEDAGIGQPVEECGLAGVRVSDDRNDRITRPPTALRTGGPGPFGVLEFPLDLADPIEDPSAIRLELRLTRTPRADACSKSRQRGALAAQAGQAVAVLGEFDLEHAFLRVGVLGEDVEDERDTVDDVALEGLLEVPLLGG